jgi:phosphate-selective porin OprO/OprP
MKKLVILSVFTIVGNLLLAQIPNNSFGKGFNIIGKDSSYTMRVGIRFQTLFQNNWTIRNDNFNNIGDHTSNFLIRRSRLKFDGFAFTPKLKYKVELGLSGRDIGGSNHPAVNYASRMILDAYFEWNFFKNFSLKVGQAKLPGNRERVISSANMQFVDRSLLNSRYNIDRDMGIQLKHHFKVGSTFIIQENFSFSQGEGRNITIGNLGGYEYTFRLEFLPFGKFSSKGDYVGSAIKYEKKPKLAVGLTYDINENAVKKRGQLGSFITDANGNYVGRTLYTFFADMMFKYKNLSVMGEYAIKNTSNGNPYITDPVNGDVLGPYYIGNGFNLQAGWMFTNMLEVAARYTTISPDPAADSMQKEYTMGVSKFFSGHQLKIQGDISYRQNSFENNTDANQGANDGLMWRMQVDIHF